MKKFTLMLIAAFVAVVSFAQKPVQLSSPYTLKTQPVKVNKKVPARSLPNVARKAAPKAQVTPPTNAEEKIYLMAGVNQYETNSGSITEAEWESRVTVVVDGSDVYVKGLVAYYMPDAWAKGTLENNVLTIADQNVGTHPNYGIDFYVAGANSLDDDTYTDLVFDYDATAQKFTARNIIINYNPSYGWLDAYANIVLTELSADDIPQTVTVPDNLKTKELTLEGKSYYSSQWNTVKSQVKVGFDGDDVYIQGLISLLPEAWVKGQKQEGKLLFPSGQYVGTYSGMDVYAIGYDGTNVTNFTFTITDEDLYTLDTYLLENGKPNDLYYFRYFAPGLTISYVPTPEEVFDYEKISISPAEGYVESLENFVLSFGGQVVTVNEDALITLTPENGEAIDGGIELLNDGTASIGLADKVTTDGKYTLNIPAGAILFQGNALSPLSFKYTVGALPDYTINPAEGKVESLSSFTITFNNYMVEETDEAAAILFNTETEAEVDGYVYAINGGKAVYVTLASEVTTPGAYQLIILDGSLKKTIDDSFLPELAFNYTIDASEPAQEDVLVEVPETATIEEWTLEGTYATNKGSQALQFATQVAFDGNDIYVQGLAYYFEEAWIKGTIANGVATFPTGQFVGEDDYGKEYLLGYDNSTITDIQFTYDAEAKTLTQKTNYILENGDSREELSFYGYWYNVQLYAGAPEVLEPVEAPADLATETYNFKAQALVYGYEDDGFQDYEIQVQVGFDGNDAYIQGIAADAPELWVKATKNDEGKYVIPANQYMGSLESWGYTFPYFFTATDGTNALLDVVLDYNAETNTFSTDQWLALNESKNSLDYYLLYQDVTITKITEVAATPATPEVVALNFESTYPNVQFSIPTVGTEGEILLTNKLFYTVWIEKDGEQQPYVFTAEVYNEDFTEDVTEVPYSYDGYDFYAGGSRVYFEDSLNELESWTKIGIQSIYYGGGETRKSSIGWLDIAEYYKTLGLRSVNTDTANARFFDLQGRAVEKNQKGLLIMKTSDGKTVKVVRK
ncbi:MAG: hypothetical protein IJV34_04760 [Prevotella sp.]|nr:hypothetical protein [Prevotella sp.]